MGSLFVLVLLAAVVAWILRGMRLWPLRSGGTDGSFRTRVTFRAGRIEKVSGPLPLVARRDFEEIASATRLDGVLTISEGGMVSCDRGVDEGVAQRLSNAYHASQR